MCNCIVLQGTNYKTGCINHQTEGGRLSGIVSEVNVDLI